MKTNRFYFVTLLRTIALLFSLLLSQSAFAHWGSKGPYGASVSASIAIDTNVYIGTYGGGVFRSTNSSLLSWTVRNNGLNSGKITAFTSIGTVVYTGTLDDGIYKSTDIGANWTKVSTGLTNQNVYSLTVSGSTLFAGTVGGGIFRSTDNGANWTAVNNGLSNLYVLSLTATATTIYAGTEDGVFVSTDNGANWTEESTNLTDTFIYSITLSGSSIFVSTESGVFSSAQTSISWVAENSGLPAGDILTVYFFNGNLYAGTMSGVYIATTDIGPLAWNAANTGITADTVTTITYMNNRFVAGTYDNGVFKSNVFAMNWTAFNTGVNNLQTRTFFAEGSLIISATNWGVMVSRDIAASYKRANSGLTDSLHVNALLFVGTTLYAGTEYGGVFVSADTGRHWTNANTGLTNLNVKHLVLYNSMLVAVSSTGTIFTSPQPAINWTSISVTFPSLFAITSILVDGSNIYASTYGDGVFVFSGTSWSAANTGLTQANVTDLAIRGTNIFASTIGGGVFVSPLSSISWTASNSGLPMLDVYSLGVVGPYVVLGLKGMVYATYDDAQSWLPTNVQLNLPAFSDITGIGFTSARVFVSTPLNSLYSNAQSELPLTPTSVLYPSGTTRSANEVLLFPNPGQGVINIGFVEFDEFVEHVVVSNVSGQVLQQASGTEELRVLSKGVYIVTITTNKGVSTQKLLVQ